MSEDRARKFCSGAGTVIYTSDVASLLATIDTLRDQLRYVEETMAPELVFHSNCKCDITSGDTPCAHCAAVHFHTSHPFRSEMIKGQKARIAAIEKHLAPIPRRLPLCGGSRRTIAHQQL